MNGMNRRQAYTLYFCHLLSAWNARCYEFAAVSILVLRDLVWTLTRLKVLFIHAAYPGRLRAISFLYDSS